MINNFSKKLGDPKNTLICIGDWSEKSPIKGKAPTKGKSMRNLFKRHGYDVYLINEFNTSKKSFIDGEDLIKFRYKGDYKCHGLLRTTSVTDENKPCLIANRDFNGSMNILKKAKCIINNKEIPKYLLYTPNKKQ